MPLKRWIESANNAIEGILYAAKAERHIRYHLYATVLVLLGSVFIGVSRSDFAVIIIAVVLVILAEMVNSAIEYLVDMVSPEYSEKARVVKDVAAGAVFITAFGAAVLGYITLMPYVRAVLREGLFVPRPAREEVILVSGVVVMILVVMIKALSGKGHPLRGGMPSGHAAVAFSAWVSVTYITGSLTVSLLCLFLAGAIARSRVALKVHTPLEALLGALLGAGTTLLLFAVFRP